MVDIDLLKSKRKTRKVCKVRSSTLLVKSETRNLLKRKETLSIVVRMKFLMRWLNLSKAKIWDCRKIDQTYFKMMTRSRS